MTFFLTNLFFNLLGLKNIFFLFKFRKMHIFQQQTQVFQNSNGHVRKAFKIVKGNDSKVMEVKGVTNKENPSIYHILKTLKKNNMAIHQYYKINETDIMHLLKEGNQEEELKNLSVKEKVKEKKVVQKEGKKKVVQKEEKKKVIQKEEKKKLVQKEKKKKVVKK
jgi:hypothetical protein